jgi:hypothetical protein
MNTVRMHQNHVNSKSAKPNAVKLWVTQHEAVHVLEKRLMIIALKLQND